LKPLWVHRHITVVGQSPVLEVKVMWDWDQFTLRKEVALHCPREHNITARRFWMKEGEERADW
jgi:hypothetical protein